MGAVVGLGRRVVQCENYPAEPWRYLRHRGTWASAAGGSMAQARYAGIAFGHPARSGILAGDVLFSEGSALRAGFCRHPDRPPL